VVQVLNLKNVVMQKFSKIIFHNLIYGILSLILYRVAGFEFTTIILLAFILAELDHPNKNNENI
jgi:hypothetical protein